MNPPNPTVLEPFITDLLPLPPVIPLDGTTPVTVRLLEVPHQFHRSLPEGKAWGFQCGEYTGSPGPTFEVMAGTPVNIIWENHLPAQFPMTVAMGHDGGTPSNPHGGHAGHGHCDMGHDVSPDPDYPIGKWHCMPPGNAVIHVHGAHAAPASDGWPENPIPRGGSHSSIFPNQQVPATLWYHDHSMHITRLNVYAGLAGMYWIRHRQEAEIRLPTGDHEIPLILQDRLFNPPFAPPYFVYDKKDGVPEFFGNTICVNGKAWPRFVAQPHRYRLRMLNGANSRFFRISFKQLDELNDVVGSALPFFQIGTDGGFLRRPVQHYSLTLAPGERADLLVDFSNLAPGTRLQMCNDAEYPFKGSNSGGDVPVADLDGRVMCFEVGAPSEPDPSLPISELQLPHQLLTTLPSGLVDLRDFGANDPDVRIIKHILTEVPSAAGPMPLLDNRNWDSPPFDSVNSGDIQIWEIENQTEDSHPIHLHLVQFRVLDRIRLDAQGAWQSIAPEASEMGWKDTVQCHPGPEASSIPGTNSASAAKPWHEKTRLIAKFNPAPGTDVTKPQLYVWHCHMLEHEDHDMMRPLIINPETILGSG